MADPLSISAGTAGVLSLGMTVCQSLLNYYDSWKSADNDIQRMCTSIEALDKTLNILMTSVQGKCYSSDIVDRVEESIALCRVGIETLEKNWKRTLYPFKESTLVKLKEISNQLRDDLGLALNVLQLDAVAVSFLKLDLVKEQVSNVSTGVDTLVSARNSAYLQEICNWLSPLAGDFERKQLDTFNTKGRQDGMGDHMLGTDQFRSWLGTRGQSIWCPGSPGVGKTVLTSYIINFLQQRYQNNDVGIAYIFFNYKEAEKQTPLNLVADLLRQLVHRKSTIPEDLKKLHADHVSKTTRPSINEYSALLRTIIEGFSTVYVVIDALDECPELGMHRDEFLAELQKVQSSISLLVTSRDILRIGSSLQSTYRIGIQARKEDIIRYIERGIFSSSILNSHVKKDPELNDAIIENIIAKAQGMFLLVRLHLDSLATKINRRSLKVALSALPESLDMTYKDVMHRITSQEREQATLAIKIISWIFYAGRLLKVDELRYALAVEPGDTTFDKDGLVDEEVLLSVCAGIVVKQHESNTIGLVHYTTQDYFKRHGSQHLPRAQVMIAETCLTYLQFDEARKALYHIDEGFTSFEEQPLLSYAVFHWANHTQGDPEKETSELILKFLEYQVTGALAGIEPVLQDFLTSEASSLHGAASAGLNTIVNLLLDRGINVNIGEFGEFGLKGWNKGYTPLHRAVIKGRNKTVELLLERGANILATGSSGQTVLHEAVKRDHVNLIGQLIEYGADIKAADIWGRTALHMAVRNGRFRSIRALLGFDAKCKTYGRLGEKKLREVARLGLKNIPELFLEMGVDVHTTAQYGNALLHYAARWRPHEGGTSTVHLFLESGNYVNTRNAAGETALYLAACELSDEALEAFSEGGTHTSLGTAGGDAALELAMISGGNMRAMRTMLERAADMSVQHNL